MAAVAQQGLKIVQDYTCQASLGFEVPNCRLFHREFKP